MAIRAAAVKVVIGKKPYTNPADEELQHALRVGRDFDKIELILEESEADVDTLTEVRSLLMKLTILPFDGEAAEHFHRLQSERVRIGTMDLKIAAICLAIAEQTSRGGSPGPV